MDKELISELFDTIDMQQEQIQSLICGSQVLSAFVEKEVGELLETFYKVRTYISEN
jgi:hypothetical protein